MCGICGYAGFDRDERLLRRMASVMAHRGPDDDGFLRENRVSLGMAVRLVSSELPNHANRTYLATLRRPMYIVHYQSTAANPAEQLQSLYGPPVFRAGEVSVFTWPESERVISHESSR